MGDDIERSGKTSEGQTDRPYEEARELLQGRDLENLKQLASDEASYPEMLFFLSAENDPEIRSKVAANPSTPIQADKVLCGDKEPSVRQALGGKIARRLPELSDQKDNHHAIALALLETLIEDEEVRVRRIIAEELKATDNIPLNIIQKLARDIDELVATPILHHSPLLDDEELISIIEDSATTARLKAIANRKEISETLSEGIVEAADVEAISQLLLNPNAQIRENILDQLIAGAAENSEWHEPLVVRPNLPFGAVLKIADFVASSLIKVLSQREDIDDTLRADLETRVHKRLADESSRDEEPSTTPLDEIEQKLRQLHARGGLNEDYLGESSERGERDVVILSLAILADIPTLIARRIFISLSAKAIMSLGWKAGVPASLAAKILGTVGHIPNDDLIAPGDDEEYPFTIREMQWQLALFLEQEETPYLHNAQDLEMSTS